jgi:hypothetical protein
MSPHTRHVLFAPFALLALLGACFSDPGSTFYEDGVTSADATSSGTTDVPTVPETTGTDPDFTEPDTSSDGLTASETGPESGGTDGPGTSAAATDATSGATTASDATTSPGGCVPVEVPIGSFSAGITQAFPLDFDDFPGAAGEEAELCATFTTENPASTRTLALGAVDGQVLGLGPCNGALPAPGPFTTCKPYTKLEGLAEVILDNKSPGAGCQDGPMGDLVLQFGCLE